MSYMPIYIPIIIYGRRLFAVVFKFYLSLHVNIVRAIHH